MNDSIVRLAKGIAAVIVLVVLVLLVGRYWSDYREAPGKSEPGTETTTTAPAEGAKEGEKPAEPKAAAPKTTKTLQVTIDGLNFREQPSSGGTAIRGLNTGEKLTLLKQTGGWYQVKDSKGVTGWVSANPQYTKVVK